MNDKQPEARPTSLDVTHDASVMWRYLAPSGHTLEMCQRPGYWKHVVKELGQQRVFGRHAWNRIEIIAEDGTWEAELRVTSVGADTVTTRLLREWHEPTKGRKEQIPEGYKIEHVEANGWRALDKNSDVVAQRLTTRDLAVLAALDHAKRASGKAD